MSAEEPGTVAMSRYGRVFRTERGWYFDDGSGPTTEDDPPGGLRPLLVLDPEDREQVERLIRAVDESFGEAPRDEVLPEDLQDMQAALRSMLAPPKPPEPQGLGAVVEDADGQRYTRIGEDCIAPWYAEGPRDTMRPYRYYADIAAVRVLSEGYTGAEQ